MIFAWAITVSAGTAQSSPKTETLKLTYGVITRVDVKFPAGCHSMVDVRLLHAESILVPLNKDTWLTGDGETVSCDVFFDLTTEPYQLKFLGASPDTSYDHEILVRVTVLPPWIASPYQVIADLVAIFKRMLGLS